MNLTNENKPAAAEVTDQAIRWLCNEVDPNALITITMRQCIDSDHGKTYLSDNLVQRECRFICDRLTRSIKRRTGIRPECAAFYHGRDGRTRKHLHIVLAAPPDLTIDALQEIVVMETTGREWIYPAGFGNRKIDEEVKWIVDDHEDRIATIRYCLKGKFDNWIN